ncbi:MAG: hypothetical protein ACI4U2_03695 [Christensenellaceae bacterium]
MGVVSVLLLFLIYGSLTAVSFVLCHFYGDYIATVESGWRFFHISVLCLVCAGIFVLILFLSSRFIRYATKRHDMFHKTDKYGLRTTDPFGVGTLATVSVLADFAYMFGWWNTDSSLVKDTTLAIILLHTVFAYILFVSVWARCQTYRWCPKCGRFWGKKYEVADEIGRETHEYKFKERERSRTVENAQGQLVASVYDDVEKTGYTVRYYYRLRHHCKHCGDWEEKLSIDKPVLFDGAWVEPLDPTIDARQDIHISMEPPAEPPVPPSTPAPQVGSAPARESLPGQPVHADTELLKEVALRQLSDKKE